MEEKNNSIYVIKVDRDNRSPEDIASDAALQIAALFNRLVEEQKKKDVK